MMLHQLRFPLLALLSIGLASLNANVCAARSIDPPLLLTTPEARDALSYAQPQRARVIHVDLDLTVDFSAHRLQGTAALDVLAAPGVTQIVLDDDKLDIAAITDDKGHHLNWSVGAADPQMGAPLTIDIGAVRRLVIRYRSDPGARALQWLTPLQTAGKTKPYLFSQGESINNRSWIQRRTVLASDKRGPLGSRCPPICGR